MGFDIFMNEPEDDGQNMYGLSASDQKIEILRVSLIRSFKKSD